MSRKNELSTLAIQSVKQLKQTHNTHIDSIRQEGVVPFS